jgi:hypothetical protein
MAPARATRAARAAPLVAALLLACASSASAAFTCTQTDKATCAALGDFYYALGGPNWTNASTTSSTTGSITTSTDFWHQAAAGTSTSYCSFLGVSCTIGVPTAARLVTKMCAGPRARVDCPYRRAHSGFVHGCVLCTAAGMHATGADMRPRLCLSRLPFAAAR